MDGEFDYIPFELPKPVQDLPKIDLTDLSDLPKFKSTYGKYGDGVVDAETFDEIYSVSDHEDINIDEDIYASHSQHSEENNNYGNLNLLTEAAEQTIINDFITEHQKSLNK